MLTANTRIQAISLMLATPTKIMKLKMPISEKLAYKTAFCISESRHLFVSCEHDFFCAFRFQGKKTNCFHPYFHSFRDIGDRDFMILVGVASPKAY